MEHAWIIWVIILAVYALVKIMSNREEIADFFSDLYKKLFQPGKKSAKSLEHTIRKEFRDSYRRVVNAVDKHPNTTDENRLRMRFMAINSAYEMNTTQDADFQAISKRKEFSFIKDIAKQERQNALKKYCGILTDSDEQMFFDAILSDIIKLNKDKTDQKGAYLIVLGADWCPHSKVFKERLENAGISQYTYIDVDEDSSLMVKYGLNEVPSTIMIDYHGDIIKKWVGSEKDGSDVKEILNLINSGTYTFLKYNGIS